MPKIRAFIAIEIPDEIRKKIGDLQSILKGMGGRISWTKPGNIHLTLKFLGDTDEGLIDDIAEELKQAVKPINQFQINVKELGTFPNFRQPRVIWVGAKSEKDQLIELAKNIETRMEILGFKREKRKYSGHLTLGRVKDVKSIPPVIDRLQQNEDFYAVSFTVKEIFLIKSELHSAGAIYTPLKKVVLSKS